MTPTPMTIAQAIHHAYQDLREIREIIEAHPYQAHLWGPIIDGSQYEAGWPALTGGRHVYDHGNEAAVDAYEGTLDMGIVDLGLYWEDGCLWASPDDPVDIESNTHTPYPDR